MCRQSSSGSGVQGNEDEKEKPFVSDIQDFHFYPTATQIGEEVRALWAITWPMVVSGLLQYSRAMISMLFLGRLGETELAGGSLGLGFANITGYSVISGLALGMEPICSQAYGGKRWGLLGLALQRMVVILLCAVIPTVIVWLNMERMLLFCKQDEGITRVAARFVLFSVPDLFAQALLHPLRIYLRSQNVTFPLAIGAGIAAAIHFPINYLLVDFLGMGIAGVALAGAWTNVNLIFSLVLYLRFSGVYKKTWSGGLSAECLSGWKPLLRLAIPSCVSVCLEWWWYEIMIILCGLLVNPKATVASMGILIQTTSLLYVFPSSLSVGVCTRVGNNLGANTPHRARHATIVALTCASAVGFVAMGFAIIVRHSWARLFTNDAEIIKLTSIALPILGVCELGNCPQTTGCGVLRGSARPSVGANINLGSFYVIGMPVALAAGFVLNYGFVGLWIGLVAAQASCTALMVYHLLRTDWTMEATRSIQLAHSLHPKISIDLAVDTEPLVAAT